MYLFSLEPDINESTIDKNIIRSTIVIITLRINHLKFKQTSKNVAINIKAQPEITAHKI